MNRKRTVFALLFIVLIAVYSAGGEKIYLGAFAMFTSAQNLGYNRDAPGLEIDFMAVSRRIAFCSHVFYSTSKKVSTNRGYSLNGNIEGLYRINKKLFVTSGIKLKYYSAALWEKKAILFFIGARFGLPDDVISFNIHHAFREHQTDTECQITSLGFSSMLFNGKTIGFQIRSNTHILRYNYGEVRKTGVSGDIGIGVFLKL